MIGIVGFEGIEDLLKLAIAQEACVLKYEWGGKFVYYLVQYTDNRTIYLICASDLDLSGFVGLNSRSMEIKTCEIPKTGLIPVIKVERDDALETALGEHFQAA